MPILHVQHEEKQQENPLLAAALDYARRGWRVVPLHTIIDGKCSCEGADCKAGKHPLTIHGLKDGTIDETTIRRWWTEAPTANVGIATGPESDLFMLGPDGQAGIEALADLEHQHSPLPPTLRSRSGSGTGRHYLFRWPAKGTVKTMANVNGLPADTRGSGGLFVAPPSLHISGKCYAWEVGPDDVPLAKAPAWLLTWLSSAKGTTKKKAKPKDQHIAVNTTPALATPALAPVRNGKVTLTVKADAGPDVVQRAVAYLQRCQPAVSGQGGHAQTFEVARAVVYGFDLGPDVGFDLLSQHYNQTCQPPWSESELRHKCADADSKPFNKPRGYLLQEGQDGQHVAAPATGASATPPVAVEEDIEALPMPAPAPWPTLPDDALHGLAGEIVTTLAPETESDPVAILGQLLAAFGSAVGRGPHFLVEGDAHHANLFLCLVGKSSHGRKGTSKGRVMQLLEHADADWKLRCVATGLSSGEGLIWAVRDEIRKKEPVKKQGRIVGYQEVVADEGVSDKRLLVSESEFAQVLRVLQREGNSLSPTMRQAWDTGTLRTLVKNNPARATGAHIAITAHITQQELVKYLKDTELFNGFANRFLWLLVRRSQVLPDGGRALDLSPLGTRLNYALAAARIVGRMDRSAEAGQLWHEVYPQLTAERPGLYGAVTGRAEAQTLRLSMIYALLDGQAVVAVPHLRAALAVWSYADASARLIFGAGAEDPLPELVLAKLRESPAGLTRTELHAAFNRNLPAAKLVEALAKLRDRGEASPEVVKTGGRRAERWAATTNEERSSAPLPTDGTSFFVRSTFAQHHAKGDAGEVLEV